MDDSEELNVYEQISITAGAIIASAATVGSLLEDPRYESIRTAFEEKLEGVVETLARISSEIILFGEAYDAD